MNSVVLIGRLVKEPELRYIQGSDNAYCRFTLAVDKGMSKEKKQEAELNNRLTADFINIVVWGRQAENCQKYLQKGRNVAIQGRLQSGSYTAQDGTRRFVTEVWAERVQFIDWGEKDEKEKEDDPFSGWDLGLTEAKDEEVPF
ncbi:single-strand binding family protein [Parvimonas sp. KA00067]|uniref:single-stranded DNA-binding protein n=1 Tax=Parvimonas sp. KA00067 TaxID=1588755 RepID=UPI00079929EB|nr:single-stranded DNA-binding protein [Parvimonas sp. KA00067]KXB66146.1 single-strand binding family protein [Parvimonas sp. KA00067]